MMNHHSFSSADFKRNSLHLIHNKLQHIRVKVNDETKVSVGCEFPTDTCSPYFETLRGIGGENNHMLKRKYFDHGCSVLVFTLSPELLSDGLNIAKKGNLRVELDFAEPPDYNTTVYMIGETPAYFKVDGDRRVTYHSHG